MTAQTPRHTGARFSPKARAPSSASAEAGRAQAATVAARIADVWNG